MDRHEVNEELSAPGAQALLTTTAAAHLAYNGQGRHAAGDPDRLLLDR